MKSIYENVIFFGFFDSMPAGRINEARGHTPYLSLSFFYGFVYVLMAKTGVVSFFLSTFVHSKQ